MNTIFRVLSVSALLALLTLGACRGCKRNEPATQNVTSCSVFNQEQTACNGAKTVDGKQCEYDPISNLCLTKEEVSAKSCRNLTADECRASTNCTYDENSQLCNDVDVTKKGTCAVIQNIDACTSNVTCLWNTTTNACEDKKNQ